MRPQKPTQQQLAILDWLHRWPELSLGDGRGQWACTWKDESARLHMLTVCYTSAGRFTTGGAVLAQAHKGYGEFDGTPRCQPATFRALVNRGWVEPHIGKRSVGYKLSTAGRETLLRHAADLRGFVPVLACGPRPKRQRKPSPRFWRRWGSRENATRSAEYHEQDAARHARTAAMIRESLALYEGSPEQAEDQEREKVESARRKWVGRGKG
jgi:hypothetical protein